MKGGILNTQPQAGLLNNPYSSLGLNILMNAANGVRSPIVNGFAGWQQGMAAQQKLAADNQYRQLQMEKLRREVNAPTKRDMKQDVNGQWRYVDTGEPVFGVQKTQDKPKEWIVGADGQFVRNPVVVDATIDEARRRAEATKQVQMDIAAASKPDAIEGTMSEIPSTTDLLRYRDPQGNPPPYDMTKQELKDFGYRLMDKPTEADRRTAYVADSLGTASSNVMSVLQDPGFDPTSAGNMLGDMTNFLASPQYQKYKAGSDEWATNLVFLRSGATARQEEKDSAFSNYWPQPGDDQSTIDFKNILRAEQEINVYKQAAQAGRVAADDAKRQIDYRKDLLSRYKKIQEMRKKYKGKHNELFQEYQKRVMQGLIQPGAR